MATDFIPRANALFTEYIKNSVNKVSLNFASYNITQDKILPLNEACDRYTLAEALATNPDTATTGT
ncbi:MAG: hypothetical protein LBN71_09320, partial [Tannerella sp.]|nr:hypothetical protein [Tannerella sp.]